VVNEIGNPEFNLVKSILKTERSNFGTGIPLQILAAVAFDDLMVPN
jgi:hypothetical protein